MKYITNYKKKTIRTCFFIGFTWTFLSGCHPFVQYPYPPILHKEAAVGAASGAIVGAEIGSATGSTAGGAGIGALVGLGLSTYLTSEVRWLKKLQRDGVQVIQMGDRVWIIIRSDDIFMFNSAAVIPEEYYVLRDVTNFIKNYGPVAPITVSGYSDNVGSELANFKLTTERAKTVAGFLWSHGIPYDRLQAYGYGSSSPIATNSHPIGSAYNRHIEITFPVVFPRHSHCPSCYLIK